MNFKNDLERKCFEAAERTLGSHVGIEHNKTITIESALCPEVASFKGPPKKEIDVLVARILDDPKVVLLVSCKQFSRRAEPAHIQEWAAVVQTMNRYSDETTCFGLVLSPIGFTSGSESWATTHNLALLPPMKGKSIAFNEDTVLRMFERILKAFHARARIRFDDLVKPPSFYDFVFRLSADYEGHQEATVDARFCLVPQNWPSSFGEMYSAMAGRKVDELVAVQGATAIKLSGGIVLRFEGNRIAVGPDPLAATGTPVDPQCRKNLSMQPCSMDFIGNLVRGKAISSAGDFGEYIEFGLDKCLNLGLHKTGFHLISTEGFADENLL